ncbi:MAG: caspase family protein [Rhodospirillales bacterium]
MRATRLNLLASRLIGAALLGATVLLCPEALSAAEGPKLPPAEYKPLPVGTVIEYSDRTYEVSRSDGYSVAIKAVKGGNPSWITAHALFGEHQDNLFVFGTTGEPIDYELSEANRKKLEAFWPLEVNKEVRYQLGEASMYSGAGTPPQTWTITLKVLRTEVINVGGGDYATFVIEEQGKSTDGMSFVGRKWYHPESGLIIQSTRTWTGKVEVGEYNYFKVSYLNEGEEDTYSLVRVRFPEGVTGHVLTKHETKTVAGQPSLPPAEYKPLPAGTKIKYDDRTYVVTRTDGFLTVFQVLGGATREFLNAYALFGEYANDLYATTHGGGGWASSLEYDINDENRKKLEAFWPLKVGNKVSFGLNESTPAFHPFDGWTVTLEVSKTETIAVSGFQYPTYVLEERGESDSGKLFVGRKWYQPDAGLVIKAERVWEKSFPVSGDYHAKNPRFQEGERDNFSMESVTYPEGTTTHALKGTKPGTGTDKALLAEVERLKRDAEKARTANAALKVREETEQKAREAELARLREELEARRRAEAEAKAHEAEVEKARGAELVRLKEEISVQRQAKAQLSESEAEALAAREAELAKLHKEAEARRAAEAARKAHEAEAEKARAVEMARLKRQAEEARRLAEARKAKEAEEEKARAAEMARLKEEAEKARRAREVEVAQLKEEAATAEKARAAEMARLKEEAEKSKKARTQEIARLRQALEKQRTAAEAATGPSFEGVQFGRYHALVIGINAYKHLPTLHTAVNDARAVAKVLEDDYGFKVTLLVNPDRREIVDALDVYAEKLGPKDNLLIYYAGHGWLNEEADRGYWLPVDARPKRRSGWVSNATITDSLKILDAKHVMVVADSCYSGTLVRSANVGARTRTGDYWKQMAEKWTRVAITSGGLEPVADKGGGGHSPFAKAFIDALSGNDGVMDGTQLFTKMRRPVMVAAQQTPQYADVRQAGHDGGDFLFVRQK